MGKSTEHTDFRNGDLFCYNCGDSHKMILPIAADVAAKAMMDFSKRHAKCAKTWVEPSPEEIANKLAIRDKMHWWLANGERGTSSATIYSVLSNDLLLDRDRFSHPYDIDDFRRCYLLLQAIPEFKPMMSQLKSISAVWSRLVDNWDELTKMFETAINAGEKKAPEMYELMKSLGC